MAGTELGRDDNAVVAWLVTQCGAIWITKPMSPMNMAVVQSKRAVTVLQRPGTVKPAVPSNLLLA